MDEPDGSGATVMIFTLLAVLLVFVVVVQFGDTIRMWHMVGGERAVSDDTTQIEVMDLDRAGWLWDAVDERQLNNDMSDF